MKKLCLSLFFGMILCAGSMVKSDAIDRLTEALKRLSLERQEGSFGDIDLDTDVWPSDEGMWPDRSVKPKSDKKQPDKKQSDKKVPDKKIIDTKLSKQESDFYLLTVDERIEQLTERWEKFEGLSSSAQALLRRQTIETMLLTVDNVLRNGISTIRKAIAIAFPNFTLAKAPIEEFADCVFLFGYLMSKITEKSYRENLQKLYWISVCMTKNRENRKNFIEEKSGEKRCVKYGCVETKKCTTVFFGYATIAFEPWIQAAVTGIDADGRHISGLVEIIVKVAFPGQDPDSIKTVKDFQNFAKMLSLMLQLFKSMQSGLMADVKG